MLYLVPYLDKSLGYFQDDNGRRSHGHRSRYGHVENSWRHNGRPEDLVGGIHGGEETARHLSDEVPGEVRRVYWGLHANSPFEGSFVCRVLLFKKSLI